MSDKPRVIADRYELGELIGRGGMAEVYRGRDPLLNREIAIKLLRSSLSSDPRFCTRFRQEAQAAARMTHATVVKVFDAGEQTEVDSSGEESIRPYIVMEFVEGTLLQKKLANGALTETESAEIISGVLTALEYSHKAGVVHRDIKPGNIMITETGAVKVMDFGIARAATETAANVAETTAILGTAQYFSPEQAKGEAIDFRTDLYSAGVVLYEMLTGGAPFQGETPVAIAYQHVREDPEPPRSIEPSISKAMDAVVLRALKKLPRARFASATAFRDAVHEALDGVMPTGSGTNSGLPPVHGDAGSGTPVAPGAFDEELNAEFAVLLADTSVAEEQMRAVAAHDNSVPLTQKGPPVAWLWAGILGVLAVLGAMVFWITTLDPFEFKSANAVKVPALVGVTEEKATAQLTELGFKSDKSYEYDSDVTEGLVVKTSPPEGESMTAGSRVAVVISRGPETVSIPRLEGLTVEEATNKLAELNLTVSSTTVTTSPNIPDQRVMGSTPAFGERIEIGESVVLNVSNGRVELPNLVGMPLAEARRTLSDLHLPTTPVADKSCAIRPGNPVTRQSVRAGQIAQGTAVKITYCIGSGG